MMCGRFTTKTPAPRIAELFQALFDSRCSFAARYNIAPTQAIAVVRNAPLGSGRELSLLKWGLLPHWLANPQSSSPLSNARAETIADKPAFRTPFKSQRCLVPVDSFFEWQKVDGKGGKQPFCIRFRDQRVFALGGIWDCWDQPGGAPLETCALITTQANELMQPIHDRMPVIISPEHYAAWLDPAQSREHLLALTHPFPPGEMEAYPVSTLVNKVQNDDVRCIEPVDLATAAKRAGRLF